MPNPTHWVLGDPAGGALVYGCEIDLDDDGEIAGGIRSPALTGCVRSRIICRLGARIASVGSGSVHRQDAPRGSSRARPVQPSRRNEHDSCATWLVLRGGRSGADDALVRRQVWTEHTWTPPAGTGYPGPGPVTPGYPSAGQSGPASTQQWPAAFTSATQSISQTGFMQKVAPASSIAPPEVWAAAVAMLLCGVLLFYPVLCYGWTGLDLLFAGEFGRVVGALILMMLTIIGSLGVALVLLAIGLLRASRVAQWLTFAACGITAVAVLSGGAQGLINGGIAALILFALVAVCAALGVRPHVRAFFARDQRPIGVAVAATANAYFGWVLVLDGLLFLLAATFAARFAFAGVLLLAAAGVLLTATSGLRTGSRAARTRTLAAYAAIAVRLIVVLSGGGSFGEALVPLLGLAGGTIGLTVPESSEAHFGDRSAAARPAAGL